MSTLSIQTIAQETEQLVARAAQLSLDEEKTALGRLEQTPLEVLPPRLSLPAFCLSSRFGMKHATASRALLLSKNYEDVARRARTQTGLDFEARLHEATAIFHQAVALRRLNQFEQAESQHLKASRELDALTENCETEAKRLRSIEVRIELSLDQAILAFQRQDYLESARMNLNAASLAGFHPSLGEIQARALLNAAVSWNRLGELQNVRRDLARGQSLEKSSALAASYALFQWRTEIDHGPFPKALARESLSLNPSQNTLFLLYQWEHALFAGTRTQILMARDAYLQHQKHSNNQQFNETGTHLARTTDFLLSNQKCEAVEFAHLTALLEKRIKNPQLDLPEAFFAALFATQIAFLTDGRWKKLAQLSHLIATLAHPYCQTITLRARAWSAIQEKDTTTAAELLSNAIELAKIHNLVSLEEACKKDLALLNPEIQTSASIDAAELPRQSEILLALQKLLPDNSQKFLLVKNSGTVEASDTEAAAVRVSTLPARTLFWDGLQGALTNLARAGVELDSKPVLMRLLSAVISKYPKALSRDELVPLVWEEAYNPLVHDNLLHGAVSRLRRVIPKPWSGDLAWDSAGLRWSGKHPFSALIPIRGTTRVLANDTKLNERQIKILTLLKYRGSIAKGDVLKALSISERTAVRELHGLVEMKLCTRQGKGPATRYFPFSG